MHAHGMQPHRRSLVGMGLALLVSVTALAAVLMMALPSKANAAPHPRHNHGLTIASTPNPITAGEGVLIYGQLKGPDSANQRIVLYHRINPAQQFTVVSITRTNSYGFYEFVRADGIVNSNRNWFVRGPGYTHSRTIHEWVSSVVTLAASAPSTTTAQPVTFSGTVFPLHPNQRVLLQEQNSVSGNGWSTIASGNTNSSSAFSIAHRFRLPGSYTLRAFFPSDPRNIAGMSPSISLTVQQEQNPSFTINASAQEITDGQPEMISGTLYANGSTTTGQPDTSVTLYAKQGTGNFQAQQTTMTDGSGNYSFNTMPLHNTVYYVRAMLPKVVTAKLFVGVQDVVNAALSSSTAQVGQTVKVTGTVTPDHAGHALYLQEQNAAGQWFDVGTSSLSNASTFAFKYTPGMMGTVNLRVQITGGPWNIGGVSSTLSLTVSGVAPVTSLPPAS